MSPDSRSNDPAGGPPGPPPTRSVRVTRTYLALPSFGHLRRGPAPASPARLVRIAPGATAEWRRLYAEIGSPYHWHDRDAWSDAKLGEHLAREDVRCFRVQALLPNAPLDAAGFLELETHSDGTAEVVYLGLHQRAQGAGLGRWLVGQAVDEARRMGATGVWLHTCTLDGPAALPNYLARGFTVTRTEEYETRVPE
jgi:ribosomal protein S18 acetylase RimI-like enzyme